MLFLMLLLFSAPLFAVEPTAPSQWTFGSFFSNALSFFNDISDFLFIEIPALFDRLFMYVMYYAILIKIKIYISSLETAFAIAKLLLSNLGVTTALQSAVDMLPTNVHALISQFGIFRAINIVFEAMVARFVLNFSVT
jgi:hypothetical protein